MKLMFINSNQFQSKKSVDKMQKIIEQTQFTENIKGLDKVSHHNFNDIGFILPVLAKNFNIIGEANLKETFNSIVTDTLNFLK
jgi:hypothetical protein